MSEKKEKTLNSKAIKEAARKFREHLNQPTPKEIVDLFKNDKKKEPKEPIAAKDRDLEI